MAFAPYGSVSMMDGGYGDEEPDGTPVMVESGSGHVVMNLGSPHIPLAAILLGLIAMKFTSESNFLSLDPQEVKVSAFNVMSVGFQAVVFILFLKLAAAWALNNKIIIPGFNELAGAI